MLAEMSGYVMNHSIVVDGDLTDYEGRKLVVTFLKDKEVNKNAAAGKLNKYVKNAAGKKKGNEAQEAAMKRYQNAL